MRNLLILAFVGFTISTTALADESSVIAGLTNVNAEFNRDLVASTTEYFDNFLHLYEGHRRDEFNLLVDYSKVSQVGNLPPVTVRDTMAISFQDIHYSAETVREIIDRKLKDLGSVDVYGYHIQMRTRDYYGANPKDFDNIKGGTMSRFGSAARARVVRRLGKAGAVSAAIGAAYLYGRKAHGAENTQDAQPANEIDYIKPSLAVD